MRRRKSRRLCLGRRRRTLLSYTRIHLPAKAGDKTSAAFHPPVPLGTIPRRAWLQDHSELRCAGPVVLTHVQDLPLPCEICAPSWHVSCSAAWAGRSAHLRKLPPFGAGSRTLIAIPFTQAFEKEKAPRTMASLILTTRIISRTSCTRTMSAP